MPWCCHRRCENTHENLSPHQRCVGTPPEVQPRSEGRPTAQLFHEARSLEIEVVKAMLYGCSTWTLLCQDVESLSIAHHKLVSGWIPHERSDGQRGSSVHGCARGDHLRTHRDECRQALTLVRGNPPPARRVPRKRFMHGRSAAPGAQ